MKEKEAKQIIESEFGNLKKEDRSQYDTLVSLLIKYGADESRPVEARVIKKPAAKGKTNLDELWKEYATWTENIGEWIHKENFMICMKLVREEGIKFTVRLATRYRIAKIFNERIEKELKK